MTLATRCAACGTVFRVVQDQLKVSEGWVRCGRCSEVFNALEGLFDLERENAPSWSPSQRGPDDLHPASADERSATEVSITDDAPPAALDGPGAKPEVADDAQIDAGVETQFDTQQATRQFDPSAADDSSARASGDDAVDPLIDSDDDPGSEAAPEPTPDFVRQAERAARWENPGFRLGLAVSVLLLGVLLAGQVALHARDRIAAQWPVTAPVLTAIGEPLGLLIEPLRRIESLTVESSGLTQLDGPALYRLQVALRNRADVALMLPALDVTLTDSRGEVVARKVLGARDYAGATTPPQLAAGAELALQAVLDTGERRVSGYSIEIFYP